MKIFKGIASAATNFIVVGIVIPYAVNYFAPRLAAYVTLPAPSEIWTVFLLFGAVFGLTGFLQSGYSKGDYPWLFGKIGSGLAGLAFFYYIFLLLPSSVGSLGSGGVESGDLIDLVGLAIFLSYAYMVFDFFDARRKNNAKKAAAEPKAAAPATA